MVGVSSSGSSALEKSLLDFLVFRLFPSTWMSPRNPLHQPSSFETDIREIKKNIKKMNRHLSNIYSEGGRWLETIDRDMAYLKKEFTRSISRTENALTGMLAELEIKFEKLELKVVKLEATKFSGSSSRHGEKAK